MKPKRRQIFKCIIGVLSFSIIIFGFKVTDIRFHSNGDTVHIKEQIYYAACAPITFKPELKQQKKEGPAYPRLAMWWPDSWNQNLSELIRYDYIGWGDWENENTLENLKQLNQDQLHFISINLTEVGWDDWAEKPIMDQIPAEWFLTQVGSYLSEDIDATQSDISVYETESIFGDPLFEPEDTIVCGSETMKVIAVDHNEQTLIVLRGFIRSAVAHSAGERIAAHITFWPETWIMNLSGLCPKVDIGNGPEQWIDWALRNALDADQMDGVIIDRISGNESKLIGAHARNIDPDCTNLLIDDGYLEFDSSWSANVELLLIQIRNLLNGKPLIANSYGAYTQLLNGAIYESVPGNWSESVPEYYSDWDRHVLGPNGYISASTAGYSPNYSLIETYEIDEDYFTTNPMDDPTFEPNYQRMRFGMTTSLLGDGYFSYEIGTNGHGSLGLMWFDEYDNAGQGRGYLGYPISETFGIVDFGSNGKVFRRDFENGIVICNPSDSVANVILEDEYWLIKGVQDPSVNTGESTSTVLLAPKDGRILLRQH